MQIASLPMYDLPEVRPALDQLWHGIADNLKADGLTEVPEQLAHDVPLHELWSDPALFLSQSCGYDIVYRYAGRLRPVATPRYAAPGCEGTNYCSVVVVAERLEVSKLTDLRGAVCVINGPESHSGMNALRALLAPLDGGGRFFSEVKVSGTHTDSLAMVARGAADVAAIDCVTYALLARHRPAALAGCRPFRRTPIAPAIPFVTRTDADAGLAEQLQAALLAAFDDPALAAARRTLLLDGIEVLSTADYARMRELEEFAAGHGYPELE